VYDHHDDDDEKPTAKRHTEFDCPDCHAHNPVHDGFEDNGEVQCFYCGQEFRVRVNEGRIKLKAV
jgi:transcription elongation factor Elf1